MVVVVVGRKEDVGVDVLVVANRRAGRGRGNWVRGRLRMGAAKVRRRCGRGRGIFVVVGGGWVGLSVGRDRAYAVDGGDPCKVSGRVQGNTFH